MTNVQYNDFLLTELVKVNLFDNTIFEKESTKKHASYIKRELLVMG